MRPATWDDVQDGETIYINNYQDGKFPQANPRISGPFTVLSVKYRRLQTQWKTRRYQGTFIHLPNNLLRED